MKKVNKGVSIIAATLSGNQGAAAMLITTLDELKRMDSSLSIFVFSYYPEADRRLAQGDNIEVVSAKPLYLALWLLPLSFLYKVLPPLRPILSKSRGINALKRSTLMLDLAGVSFVDGREKFLLYNLATLLPARLMKVKVIKLSQALGPFKSKLNRLVGGWFLPKLDRIFARGEQTRAGLDSLGLTNVDDASDIAFMYHPDEEGESHADKIRKDYGLGKQRYIVVAPSSVLFKKAQKQGLDYVADMSKFIDWATQEFKVPVLMLAHSIREDENQLHNNDIPVCREILRHLQNRKSCHFVEEKAYINTIKALIADSQMVITGRFHGMIGALSAGKSVVVTGWSHKYQEVLDSLGVSVPAVYLDQNFLENLKSASREAHNTIKQTEKTIAQNLPTTVKKSKRQFAYVEKQL